MKEVKKEIFGSRNSILKNILIENNISYLSNVWVVTCRYAINSNKNTRYLICIEDEVDDGRARDLLKHVGSKIPVINVCINEDTKIISVFNLKTKKESILTYDMFKKALIKTTCCKYIESYALGSVASTPLSRFFRENMGKGFALTDIDFFITSKGLFIEEKNYIKKDEGYLGVGQCISMKETINDIFKNIDFLIVCFDSNDIYIADVKSIDCKNTIYVEGWGNMVGFKLKNISKYDLLSTLRGQYDG